MRNIFTIIFLTLIASLSAGQMSVASYNCGGLPNHYDYIRATTMGKLTAERIQAEPELLEQVKELQQFAVKLFFAESTLERDRLKTIWKDRGYCELACKSFSHPDCENSINAHWRAKFTSMLSTYRESPIEVRDQSIRNVLINFGTKYANERGSSFNCLIKRARRVLAENAFQNHLKQDVICLQEDRYLTKDLFPSHYQVILGQCGMAWNTKKYRHLETMAHTDRYLIILLEDRDSGERIAISSAHLEGCDPFSQCQLPESNLFDSTQGNETLHHVLETLDQAPAQVKILAMDANVCSTHPRMRILANYGFKIDLNSPLEATCTNPLTVLPTRIDWIAVKGESVQIENRPIHQIKLNDYMSNFSDHKPIGAEISY